MSNNPDDNITDDLMALVQKWEADAADFRKEASWDDTDPNDRAAYEEAAAAYSMAAEKLTEFSWTLFLKPEVSA